MQIKSSPHNLALHEAVKEHDVGKIRQLRSEGHKAHHLDEKLQSPVDLLARRRSIDQQLRENMHSALLASQNPTAPKGYTKPEALHGSPWGFEILASGELKGGVNDTKGGWASLEGQVFFSDRTQGKTDDLTTRQDLRSKARDYSEGKGIHSSSPYSRAFQHRMTQALDYHFASGKALNATGDADKVEMEEGQTLEQSATLWLQNFLKEFRSDDPKKIDAEPFESKAELMKFPASLDFKLNGQSQHTVSGDALKQFVAQANKTLQQQLEDGKAPLLGMVNNGKIVPMVFGFSKIDDLKNHTVPVLTRGNGVRNFSYQSENHPLGGSAKGGKLKEIELCNLQDLATLSLTCMAKGVKIPADTLIRINPTPREKRNDNLKARYLDPQQLDGFQQKLVATLKENNHEIQNASLKDLQQFNQDLRNMDLNALL